MLGGVPNAQDGHRVVASDPVDDDVGRQGHQFERAGLPSRPAAARESNPAVAREQQFAADAPGCDRIVSRDVTDDTADIG